MNNLMNAKEILLSGGYTCVLIKDERIYTSKERGVKPLIQFFEGKEDLSDFSAADKVVGKATAFLYALLGVKEVYASVISKGALCVLRDYGIDAQYETLTDYIINRKGTDICPFEKAVSDVNEKEEAYRLILSRMKEMNT